MRLGIIGETLMERLVARLNMAPDPLLETQIAFSMARSIMAGVRLGVFEAIGTDVRTAKEVAVACKTDGAATTKLMDMLVGCRYLSHRHGRYMLTAKSRKWLLRSSVHSITDKLLFQYDEWNTVAKYEQYITTGRPLDIHSSMTDAAAWNRYQLGMRALASISADEVAQRLPMPTGATALLDIGGSHGYYSVCMCRRHRGLQATILDLPQAIEHAAPILEREGMGERVAHRAGDALSDELGRDAWEVVFVSQLVHHFSDKQNCELVRRIAESLRPGGVCVVLEILRPSSPEGNGGIGAVLDLYFAATSESGTWPLETIQNWQRDAGLTAERPILLRTLPGAALVVGRKPPARKR